MKVFILMDWDNYNISSALVFKTKKALERYVGVIYTDKLNPTTYINWETGEVLEDGNRVTFNDEPIAVIRECEVKE